MKIRLKNIPEGFKIENNKLVKVMKEGGSTSNTLQPVDREDANVEAEKNETVLTDIDSDGFFELFNIGGKRHSEGGTPLNLPEQSFIFSDTRKMKFTKEELKELGITSTKKMTPAAVSKKFPINKYLDVLKDESADRISITSAEAMVKKNKVKLSQIAFMQEKKKNFEDGLPLAAYPFLLENGIDPQEFEQKIKESQQREQGADQQAMHQMPDGTMMQGAAHGQEPQQGGQQEPSPEMMQQMMAMQQGMQGMPPQGPPQGMPPQGMQMQEGGDLHQFVYGENLPKAQDGLFSHADLTQAQIDEQYNGMMKYNKGNSALEQADRMIKMNNTRNNNQVNKALDYYSNNSPSFSVQPRTILGNVGTRIGNIFRSNENDVDPNYKISEVEGDVASGPHPGPGTYQNGGSIIPDEMGQTYTQWRVENRLQDIPEVQMMFLNTMQNDAPIMPGHSNMEPASVIPEGLNEMMTPVGQIPGWIETLRGFTNHPVTPPTSEQAATSAGTLKETSSGLTHGRWDRPEVWEDVVRIHKEKFNNIKAGNAQLQYQEGGQMIDPRQQQVQQLAMAQQQLSEQRAMIINAVQSNPEQFESEAAQMELSAQLQKLDMDLADVSGQLQMITEQKFMEDTTIPLNEFFGETSEPMQNTNEYYNPQLLMAEDGVELGSGPIEDDAYLNDPWSNTGMGPDGPVSFDPAYNTRPQQYTGPMIWENGKLGGTENPNYDSDFEEKMRSGVGTHTKFYDIMAQSNFEPVRNAWIKAYADLDAPGKIDEADPKKLFKAFNDMNILFTQAFAGGVKFNDNVNFKKQLAENAKRLGLPVPTDREIKMYQGMYNSLATAKETGSPEVQNLLKQVNVNYSDNPGGSYEIVEGSGNFVSDIDGLIGDNTSNQFASVVDGSTPTEEIIQNDCTDEVKAQKRQKCMELGKGFSDEACDCVETPEDIIPPKIPPYITFPGDDMKVGALSALSLSRDKKYGVMQNYNPIMRDPGYVDDRAAVAATTALANQALGSTRNESDVQGRAQNQIDKIQSNRWATNTKIFDNTQAYNVAELNKAQLTNQGFMSDYVDMVNTVDQNYDNVKNADMMNLVDAEVNRMDNADRLYEDNMKRPNFYYDPQKHSTIFQNERGIEAYKNQTNSGPISLKDAMEECKKMLGTGADNRDLLQCAKQRMGSTDVNNTADRNGPIDRNGPAETMKYGGTIREKDLMESKMKLRNWIMGI